MTGDWLGVERGQLAAERILDAAGRVFLASGVATADMAEIAAEAGCSRATVYRYFENRRALQVAYIHREARRVAAEVAGEAAGQESPGEQITAAVLAAVRIVRETPVLATWFAPGSSGTTAELAGTSDVVAGLCSGFLPQDEETAGKARWLMRVIMSLITVPGRDAEDERAMVRNYVVPVLVAEPAPGGAGWSKAPTRIR